MNPGTVNSWGHLVSELDGWAISAEEVGPGRIRVVFRNRRGGLVKAKIVMTRRDWDDMWATMWGDVELGIDQVRQSLLRLGRERYLVYNQYELDPSMTPELPTINLGPS